VINVTGVIYQEGMNLARDNRRLKDEVIMANGQPRLVWATRQLEDAKRDIENRINRLRSMDYETLIAEFVS